MSDTFGRVAALFQSIGESVRVTNRLDEAYANGVGHPEYHTPFDLETNPQMVAMNLAGLYAADTCAHIIGQASGRAIRTGDMVTGGQYLDALQRISDGDLSNWEKYVAKNCANIAWRAGQPFRDIETKPLNRITRDVNMPFAMLTPDEEDKDLVQIQEGGRILIEWITAI